MGHVVIEACQLTLASSSELPCHVDIRGTDLETVSSYVFDLCYVCHGFWLVNVGPMMAAHFNQALAFCSSWLIGQVPDGFQLHLNTAVSFLLLAGAALGLSRRAHCMGEKKSVGFETRVLAQPQSHFIPYVKPKSLKHTLKHLSYDKG